MNTLSDEQVKEIEKLIEIHGVTRRLSSGQKWDVVILLSGFLAGAVALLGAGGFFVVNNASREAAAEVSASDVSDKLAAREEFLDALVSRTAGIPSGTVAAFDDKTGCPAGWSDFASARGRMIIGATPPDGEAGGLTRREWQQLGGEEAVVLLESQMPRHDHSGMTGAESVARIWYDEATRSNNFVSTGDPGLGLDNIQTHTHPIPAQGQNEPHNNIPPYIALYFCKKN